jgi:hypothetical protein
MLPHGSSLSRSRVSLVVAGAILLFAGPAFAFGMRADYVEVAAWDTGYQAQYTIANDGPGSVSQWTVAFDLPTSDTVSSSWDSVLVRSGQHLVFTSAAWNGALAPGQATSFGFVVVGHNRPANCTINGGPCNTLPALSLRRAPPSRDPAGARRVAGGLLAVAIAPASARARRLGRRQGASRAARRVLRRWLAAQH